MTGFRISSAAVLLTSVTLSVAAAESATTEDPVSDTAWQHHVWSQKFDMMPDPDATGSIAPHAVSGGDARQTGCAPAGLRFSSPPLPDWRIGTCS